MIEIKNGRSPAQRATDSNLSNLSNLSPLYLNHRKSQIRQILLTKFYLLDYLERDQLAVAGYFLLYWSGWHLKAQLREGQIIKDGISYGVIYHNCTPESAFESDQVSLSFRIPTDATICGPKCLVKIIR